MMVQKLLFIFLFIISSLGYAQIVNIPDPVFKYGLVNYTVADLDGDGTLESDVDTNDDGEIQVSEAEAVIGLEVPAYTVGGIHIQSLEGIEAFVNLEFLNCSQQEITSLNLTTLSQLKELHCHTNLLTSIDVTQNTTLEYFTCIGNPIVGGIDTYNNPNLTFFQSGSLIPKSQINFLDVTQNPLLEVFNCSVVEMETIDTSQNPLLENFTFSGSSITSIDITQNTALSFFGFSSTGIESLDLSKNINLISLSVDNNQLLSLDISSNPSISSVRCQGNQLTYLNVNNGNNTAFFVMDATDNPDLKCIQVDDVDYSNLQTCNGNQGWCKDSTASYSSFCELGIQDLEEEFVILFPNPTSEYLFINSPFHISSIFFYNTLGQELLKLDKGFNQIPLFNLPKGTLFVIVETGKGKALKTIIKE